MGVLFSGETTTNTSEWSIPAFSNELMLKNNRFHV